MEDCVHTSLRKGVHLKENFQEKSVYESDGRISSLFSVGSFLFIGTEKGVLEVVVFNDIKFQSMTKYLHKIPVEEVVGIGNNVYISDYRNKITEYPSCSAYHFIAPRIYYGRYLFCVEGNKVYVKTPEAFGMFVEIESSIERLYFSEDYEYAFLEHGDGTVCVNMLGEIRGKYEVKGGIFSEGELIWYADGRFNRLELYLPKTDNYDISFRPVEIKEKKVKCKDDEGKWSAYIEEGGRSLHINKKMHVSKYNIDAMKSKEKNNTNARKPQEKNISREKSIGNEGRNIIEDSSMENNYKVDGFIRKTNQVYLMPSSFNSPQANLMHYSTEGCMISIGGAISNFISISFHDNQQMPMEIKDDLKSTMGSFFGRNFVVSNGVSINFNDAWRKDEPAKLIGMSSSYVFVFNENLRFFDFLGTLVHEVYLPDFYTFCSSDKKLAVFSTAGILLIELDEFSGIYVNLTEKVSFATFSNNILYVQIRNGIYKLHKNLLMKIYETAVTPLIVAGDYMITLQEPITLLPKPFVDYYKIITEKVDKKEIALENTSKFNIYEDKSRKHH